MITLPPAFAVPFKPSSGPPAGPSRLYVSNDASPYTPTTKRGAWNDPSATLAKKLGVKSGVAATSTKAETSATNNYDVLHGRWVSDALAYAFTISGTVSWCFGWVEAFTGVNGHIHVHIFVTQGDSDTLRGTLLSDYIDPTELGTAAAGMGVSGVALSDVAVQVGDRIVVELGVQHQNTVTASSSTTMHYGNTGATDLTDGNANVNTQPGWVEFSAGLGLP